MQLEERKLKLQSMWFSCNTINEMVHALEYKSRHGVIHLAHVMGLPPRTRAQSADFSADDNGLRVKTCQWIEGDICDDEHKCGEKVVPGRSYCLDQCKRVFVKRKTEEAT
jgi:hypothetical protein